jgi:uncharacterized protein YkwD
LRTRHRRPTRTRYRVLATAVLGLLGAGVAGVASAQTIGHHRAHARAVAQVTPHLGPATELAGTPRPTWTRHPRPHPSATTSKPTATPTTGAPTTVPTTVAPTAPTTAPTTVAPTAPTTTAPTRPPTTAPTTAAPTTAPAGNSVIEQALAHINAARTANGLGTLALSADLSKATEAHNALMVSAGTLSHQFPGEAGLGDRFTAAGVSWTSAGENIGQSNGGNNDASIVQAANGLTDLMLAEQPPNDGHRKNLLNPSFKHIGLAVTRGSDGRVWFTQDFVN